MLVSSVQHSYGVQSLIVQEGTDLESGIGRSEGRPFVLLKVIILLFFDLRLALLLSRLATSRLTFSLRHNSGRILKEQSLSLPSLSSLLISSGIRHSSHLPFSFSGIADVFRRATL